jgi:hypothetical protein
MVRMVAAALAATAFLCTAAQADPSPYYNVRDYVAGTGSAGSDAGTHQVSGSSGSMTTIVSGGGDPSVEVIGSMAVGIDGNLYGSAGYAYHLSLSNFTAATGEALARQSLSGPDEVVGHLTGTLRVNATMNSLAQVSLAALKPGYGGSSLGGGCAGYSCSPGFAPGASIPFTLDVDLSAFDFGCAPNPNTGVMEGTCTTGTTSVSLAVQGMLHSAPGLSGGSIDAYIDPIFTLDDAFLQDHGLTADSLIVSQDSVASPSPAPEPTSWAMMVGGFGLVGSAMRARGRKIALSAWRPANCS